MSATTDPRVGGPTPEGVRPKRCPTCDHVGEWPGQPCPRCIHRRLVGRNRRLRSLLVDALGYLERADHNDLVRRARLADRIREAVEE